MKAVFIALIAVCLLSLTLAQRNGRPAEDADTQNDHPTRQPSSGNSRSSSSSKDSHDLPTHYAADDLIGHGIISLSGQFCGDIDNLLMKSGVKPYDEVDGQKGSWYYSYISKTKRWLMYNLKTACKTCPCCVPATALGEVCGFKDQGCSAWVQLDINGVILQFNAVDCSIEVDKRGIGLITLSLATPGFAAIEDVRLALGLVGTKFARVQWLDGITLSGTLERNLALDSSKYYDNYDYSAEGGRKKDYYPEPVKCDVAEAQDACSLNCGDLLGDKAGGILMMKSALESVLTETCDCIYVKDGYGWGSWGKQNKPDEISDEKWSSGSWGTWGCYGDCCEAECCKALSDVLEVLGPCANLAIGKLDMKNQEKLALLLDHEFQKQYCPCPFGLASGSAICYHQLPAKPEYFKIWCKSCYGSWSGWSAWSGWSGWSSTKAWGNP